jgi:hypothetical protein
MISSVIEFFDHLMRLFQQARVILRQAIGMPDKNKISVSLINSLQ